MCVTVFLRNCSQLLLEGFDDDDDDDGDGDVVIVFVVRWITETRTKPAYTLLTVNVPASAQQIISRVLSTDLHTK